MLVHCIILIEVTKIFFLDQNEIFLFRISGETVPTSSKQPFLWVVGRKTAEFYSAVS